MEALLIFSVFLLLMALGAPIGAALGIAAVVTIYYFDLGIGMLGVNFSNGIASFPLLAIPFFVLAGVILERAGLAATIARFFELLVGKAVGGLAMVAVLTCMFWGALSGSGPATTAAVGLILLSPMLKHGYDKNFAGATIANAADLSIIIPPSIAFIIYGNITSVSVSALFVAGVVPGLLTGAGTVLVAYLISRKRGYRGLNQRGSLREILTALRKSVWAILAPALILGGIYTGIFTPTEAAVVAVFYSLFVAVAVYRSLTLRDFVHILVDCVRHQFGDHVHRGVCGDIHLGGVGHRGDRSGGQFHRQGFTQRGGDDHPGQSAAAGAGNDPGRHFHFLPDHAHSDSGAGGV